MAPSKYAAALALAGVASALPKPAGPGAFIVGGSPAEEGEFPYIVSLRQGGEHFCGGSLLNANTVLTAAHCTDGQQPAGTTVCAGTIDRTNCAATADVEEMIMHPSYDSAATNNDVAIWKLSSSLEGEGIEFVTLPEAGFDPAANSTVTVAGWGTTSSGGANLPEELLKVSVPVTDRETCNEQYDGAITDAMICAGLDAGGKDACQGDSGGPLVNDAGEQVGVVSWGQGCAEAGFSGVYANVGGLMSFIQNNI